MKANKDRPDVDTAHKKGANHGFDVVVEGGRGGAKYEIHAINFGAGGNPKVATGVGPVKMTAAPSVSGSPSQDSETGAFEGCGAEGDGYFEGWFYFDCRSRRLDWRDDLQVSVAARG